MSGLLRYACGCGRPKLMDDAEPVDGGLRGEADGGALADLQRARWIDANDFAVALEFPHGIAPPENWPCRQACCSRSRGYSRQPRAGRERPAKLVRTGLGGGFRVSARWRGRLVRRPFEPVLPSRRNLPILHFATLRQSATLAAGDTR